MFVLDVYLMIIELLKYVELFVEVGVDVFMIYLELVEDFWFVLCEIKVLDVVVGIVVNFGIFVELVWLFVLDCDLVLVMSVEVGFGG